MTTENRHLNAKTDRELRIKTGMVVFALETAIGDYLKEEEDHDSDDISETYFIELVDTAVKATSNTTHGRYFVSLKKLIESYNISEVRNIASHPNRSISDTHWYRIAALASDPVITQLGLQSVKEAMVAAHENRLQCPPDHWYAQEQDAIPNNLPRNYEHRKTGFVGRRQELVELRKAIQNPRIPSLCIVGRGGCGKTAIAIDLLESLANDPVCPEWCEGIVFISAKTEKLTVDGLVALDNATALTAILERIGLESEKLGLTSTLDGSREGIKKLTLLCIDNLETILSKDEDAYTKINNRLPVGVKLLLTSRIPVDGATNHVLRDLSEGEGKGLASRYYTRVIGQDPTNDQISKIVSRSSCNPLAIKLTIDCIARGDDEDKAIGRAASDVVEYSYSNLLQSLTGRHIEVLEVLFAAPHPLRRSEICGVLACDLDEIAPVLLDLSKTTLIVRAIVENGEGFELSEAVRPLVRKSSRHLDVRKNVQEKLKKRNEAIRFHELQQKDWAMGTQSEDYVDPNHPEDLKHLLIETVRALRSDSTPQLVDSLGKFDDLAHEYQQTIDFMYFWARLLRRLGDLSHSKTLFLRCASECPDKIWTSINIGEIALHHGDLEDLEESILILDRAKPSLSGDISDYTRVRYWDTLYRCIARSNKYPELTERANTELGAIAEDELCYDVHCSYKALGIAYSVRSVHRSEPQRVLKALAESLTILNSVRRKHGTGRSLATAFFAVSKEAIHHYKEHGNLEPDQDFVVLSAIEAFFVAELESDDEGARRSQTWIIANGEFLSSISVKHGNPFKRPFWRSFTPKKAPEKPTQEEVQRIKDESLDLVFVHALKTWPKGFVFASRYNSGRKDGIFVHRSCLRGEHDSWIQVRAERLIVGKIATDENGRERLESGVALSDWRTDGL